MSEKAPWPPGLCLESGEFVPAEAITARAKASQAAAEPPPAVDDTRRLEWLSRAIRDSDIEIHTTAEGTCVLELYADEERSVIHRTTLREAIDTGIEISRYIREQRKENRA
jgi:hypothetical protein